MAHCLPRPFTHSNLPVCGDTKVPTAVRKSARRIRFHRFNSISNLLRTIQGQNRKEEKIYIYIRERERERERNDTRNCADDAASNWFQPPFRVHRLNFRDDYQPEGAHSDQWNGMEFALRYVTLTYARKRGEGGGGGGGGGSRWWGQDGLKGTVAPITGQRINSNDSPRSN